jgi:hypothetical protein
MEKTTKKNCNKCRYGLYDQCSKLTENEEYQALHDWNEQIKYKSRFVCDEFASIYIEYPITVSKINTDSSMGCYRKEQIGKFAKVRPCGEEYGNKTYLGLFLGELPIGQNISYNRKSQVLDISFRNNPAIFVFELNKIIYGIESWWGIIETENDLKDISDQDINNIWYVKALNSLSGNK